MAIKKPGKRIKVSFENTPSEDGSLNELKDKLQLADSDQLPTVLKELTKAGWDPSSNQACIEVNQAVSRIIERELGDCEKWNSDKWSYRKNHIARSCLAKDFTGSLTKLAFESHVVSKTFLRELEIRGDRFRTLSRNDHHYQFPFFLKVWTLFVAKSEIFDWMWLAASVTEENQYRQSPYRDGSRRDELKGEVISDTISEFTRILDEALDHRNLSIMAEYGGTSNQPWRDQALTIMELLLRMIAAPRGSTRCGVQPSVDLRLAQESLREQLDQHPDWIPIFVRFYLDQVTGEQRDLIEGMLDRVQATDEVIEALESYHGSPDVLFHARALASDLRGELPAARHAHTPRPRLEPEPFLKPGMQNWGIWLEYPEAHELIVLATEKAMAVHRADLDKKLGQDEHELCENFITRLCDHLNEVQHRLNGIFHGKNESLRLNAEIKRFPKTSTGDLPTEGGKKNAWHADLGILVHAKFPALIEMHRGTLFQAKKLNTTSQGAWLPDLDVKPDQLKMLLAKSRESQYLFFLPSSISARSPLVLRAQLLQDMLKAQKKLQRSVLKRAGKSFVESFAYDLVGGWYGDDDAKLIEALKAGKERFQGPMLILDVTIEVGENG